MSESTPRRRQDRAPTSSRPGTPKARGRAAARPQATAPATPVPPSTSNDATPKGSRPTAPERPDLTEEERDALVCALFTGGTLTARIPEVLYERHGVKLHRTAIYRILQKAAQRGLITFNPPAHLRLAQKVKDRFPQLDAVEVARAPTIDGVTCCGARVVWQLVRQVHASKHRDPIGNRTDQVGLGFSGGCTLRSLSRHFADHLVQVFCEDAAAGASNSLPHPSQLCFHAMVAGFDPYDPTTEPNAMFTHLHLEQQVPIEMKFVAFNAPPVVHREQLDLTREIPQIRAAYDEARNIDIVVTSMGVWSDGECMLRRCMGHFPEACADLEAAGVIGDLMWQPIGPRGPLLDATDIRAMTVMDLPDLTGLIRRRGKVVLVVGPCSSGRTKSDVLATLLDFTPQLVSHLVVDSLTARELVA